MQLISAWTLFLGKLEKPSRCFSFINFAVTAGAKKGKFGHFPRKSARIFTEIVLFSIPRNQKQDPQVLTTIKKAIIESSLYETKIVRTDVVFRCSLSQKLRTQNISLLKLLSISRSCLHRARNYRWRLMSDNLESYSLYHGD